MGYRAKLNEALNNKSILVVGAGGIGCELLKNVVLTGFKNIHVIDLDTIDVSNLNRQFLFRREHVGKSKAEVATAAVGGLLPGVNIVHDHDSIFNKEKFGLNFFKKFDLVMNALDNRAARNHVNRLCLSAGVPLIESGSAGYLGQVSVIVRGETECYECVAKQAQQKTFPGCTIRNTPSEHIHCTVWSKHLFNQLFGEIDIDDDVSPDLDDEENKENEGTEGAPAENGSTEETSASESAAANGTTAEEEAHPIPNTRVWAEENGYDAQKLFNKVFFDDIAYLLKMKNLWKERRPPRPIQWGDFDTGNEGSTQQTDELTETNKEWTLDACARVFSESVEALKDRKAALPEGQILHWDKDDEDAMRFVAACANIRARIFGIPGKSCFEIKSMAGNIIPAIATTNAMVAGMVVVETLKLLTGKKDKVRTVFINRKPNPRGKILMDQHPDKPNPKCYVCSEKREVFVKVNPQEMVMKTFIDKVLKVGLCMQQPDVTVVSNGSIVVSSEEGETTDLESRTLTSLSIMDGVLLECDDFSQELNFMLCVCSGEKLKADEYEIMQDSGAAKPEPTPVPAKTEESRKRKSMANGESADDETVEGVETKRVKVDGQVEEEEKMDVVVASQ